MTYKQLLSVVLWLTVTISGLQAQGLKYEYGHIDEADLAMTSYEADANAAAVMLLNFADYYERAGRILEARVHQRIKILTNEGLNWGNHSVKYMRAAGKPRDVKMTTYNLEDGQLQSLEIADENIKDAKLDETYSRMTFTLPQVKAGSVVELTYIYPISENNAIPDWDWQLDIPVRFSELIIDMGRGGLTRNGWRLRGALQPEEPEEKKHNFHYLMRDIPAMADEPYVFSRDNYRSSHIFESRQSKSWDEVLSKLIYAPWFGETFKFNKDLKRFFPKDAKWGPNERSLQEIYTFVRDHFTWDEYVSALPSKRPRATWESGKGDSGEINSVLINMLRINDIVAEPVLMSTTSYGKIDQDYPMMTQFNNLIVYVLIDGKEYLLDATEKSRPFNVLPNYCLNGQGLIVSEDRPAWVSLNLNKERELETATVEYEFDAEGYLTGKVSMTYKGLAAYTYRDKLLTEGEEAVYNEYEEWAGELNIDNFEIANGNAAEKPMVISYTFKAEDPSFANERVLLVNPLLVRTFSINPLKAESRELPVEFYAPMFNTSLFRFKIPEGYGIKELPEAKSLKLPNGDASYTYSASVLNGYLEVLVRFNIRRLSFSPEIYPALKSFFDLMIEKQQGQVVLERN